jgi:nucleoside-diphosphate-sugar epimerase
MNPAFWNGKRVLLTGHTGFKGSWLSLWLQSMGAQVVGYALAPPTNPSLFDVAEVGKGMTSIIGDIRDLAKLQAVFAEYSPEIVIHKHFRINHSKIFADKRNHINGIENFWNQAKRHMRKFNRIPKAHFGLFFEGV